MATMATTAATKTKLTDRQVAQIAKALADPRRYLILKQIADQASLLCSALNELHDVSAPTISHHLKELASAGLIEVRRDGKSAVLTFNREVMKAYADQLAKI